MRARAIVIAVALAAVVWPATAQAAKPVTYPELLAQVEHGPLIRAIINRKRGDIEIKFRDLSEWEAFYPPGAQPQLQRLLHQRHIRVIFASSHHAKAKASHHVRLRYIAAGVLGAVVLVAGAWLLISRRSSAKSPRRDTPAG